MKWLATRASEPSGLFHAFNSSNEPLLTVRRVVFVLMVIASAVFAGLAWTVPIQKRLYHIITTLIVIFASLSYFAMATGHGVSK